MSFTNERLILISLLCLCSFSFISTTAEAIPFGSFGARAMGMGNSFTAVSDDLTAVFWNPAGLGYLQNIQITLPYGRFTEDRENTGNNLQRFQDRLFSTGLPDLVSQYKNEEMSISSENNIGFVFGMPGFGLSLIERSFASVTPQWSLKETTYKTELENGSELLYSGLKTYKYALSFCYGSRESGYFIGANANYVEYKSYFQVQPIALLTSTDAVTLSDDALDGPSNRDSLWSYDLGLLLFLSGYKIGITAKDINKPAYQLPDDSEIEFKPQYRAGISFPLSAGMIASIDYDLKPNKLFNTDLEEQLLSIGTEMSFVGGQYRLRAGGHKNTSQTGSPFHYTLGFGLNYAFFSIDSAASINPDTDIWNWSATVTINF